MNARNGYGPRILAPVVFLCLTFAPGNAFPAIAAKSPPSVEEKKNSREKVAEMEWKGSESELKVPFTGVISNERDWKKLWIRAFHKKAPAVDFKRYAVACVFLGHYPGWWYSISISRPETVGATIRVPYYLVALIVELQGNEGGFIREYGSRGQYMMRVVERVPGREMKMGQVGKPTVPLREDFRKVLEKDRLNDAE